MPKTIRVSWEKYSDFFRVIQGRIKRKTLHYRWTDDPEEPMCEVWAGLKDKFMDGQILEGDAVGRLLTIIDRRVSNYFKSKGARPIKQPSLSQFELRVIERDKSALEPHQSAIKQEQFRLIEKRLSEMAPHRAEAVRSRYGYPGALEEAELVHKSGTTRQNVSKHAQRGFEELKPMLAKFLTESL